MASVKAKCEMTGSLLTLYMSHEIFVFVSSSYSQMLTSVMVQINTINETNISALWIFGLRQHTQYSQIITAWTCAHAVGQSVIHTQTLLGSYYP